MTRSKNEGNGHTLLLTGGSGFLGTFIVNDLLSEQSPLAVKELRIVDLKPLKAKVDDRVTFVQGDIRDRKLMSELCNGVDLVINTAAIVDWGTRPVQEVTSVNFDGTRVVLEACLENKVKALLQTTTLDVLFDGSAHVDVDETAPYPEHHTNAYCLSKYLGERAVLEANGDAIWTCVIRPSDIFGEGDPYHLGSLVGMAKGGFYVRLGKGKAKCQPVYAGNMSHAHVLAAKALLEGNEKVRGKAYFVTDGPGENFFKFFDAIVLAAGYRIWPKNIWLPRWFAYGLGAISEFIAFLVRPIKWYNPKLSRYAVTYTCTDYTIVTDLATKDFGYTPKYSREEAFERTAAYFRRLK